MKKIMGIISFLAFTASFYSCNEITVEEFVLTDENTHLHNISYKYWYPAKSKTLKKDDIFVVENAEKELKKKLWMITPFESDSKKKEVIYLRRRETEKKCFIFQATSWEKGKNISLFLGGIVNDSTIQFYGFNDDAMAFASKSDVLNDIKGHIFIKKDKISFDSIASSDYKQEILEFIKELNNPKYYEEEIVTLIGTNDFEKIKSLLE